MTCFSFRTTSLAVVLVLAALPAPGLQAQDTIVSTRVGPNFVGVEFSVDGTTYRSPQLFLWPAGSKHTLEIRTPVQTGIQDGVRYTFTNWKVLDYSDNRLILPFTADRAISSVVAEFTVEYRVLVHLYDCGLANPSDPCLLSPGEVQVAGQVFNGSGEVWLPAGEITLAALPKPGFVFSGWRLGAGTTDSFISKITLAGPIVLSPRFEPAKRVTLETSPPGLKVLADRQTILTPATLDWAQNSRHVLGAPSPQYDLDGVAWVFDSWAHGGGQNSLYITGAANVRETLTARFVRGMTATFYTNPTGLKLSIDGRENWMSYSFIWGIGSQHEIAAPAEQKDAAGRRYVFKGWSNGGSATQQIVPTEAQVDAGIKWTANYELLGRLSVETSPAGLPVLVDGVECRSPCVYDRAGGTQMRIAVPASIPVNDGTRLDFTGWSDAAAAERLWTFGTDARTLTARYQTRHRLVAFADPAEGAVIRREPASADSFYAEGERVTVSVESNPGYRFRGWDGDLTGPYRSGVVPVVAPRAVRALLDRVPYLAPAGVRNAAAETPEPGVAAGSIVSIVGASLATAYEAGPPNPLAQTIGGVTAKVGGRLLPLLFVSPEQINAQLPSDLAEGEYSLTVKCEGQPEVSTTFTVARNAPGLFLQSVDALRFALAAHEDGTPITPESPARRGELVSVFGTGFGPYLVTPPDGFQTPAKPDFPLADRVEVLLGEATLGAESAAAPGQIGVVVTRFRVPADLPAGPVDLRVRVNERVSNTVPLPIE